MENLIQIAFSSLNNRLEIMEKQTQNLQKTILKLSKKISKQNKIIDTFKSQIALENTFKNTENSEMEEYKFGK